MNSVTLDGVLELLVSDPSSLHVGDTFNVFEATITGGGSITYNFSDIIEPDLGNGLVLNTENLTIDGTVTVAAVPVPEPATILHFLLFIVLTILAITCASAAYSAFRLPRRRLT